LLIQNGAFDIESARGAAIGTTDSPSRIDNLTIRNGTFVLNGVLGIGSSHSGSVRRLFFHRERQHALETPLFVSCSGSKGICMNADEIEILDCPISAVTTTPRFLGGDLRISVQISGGVPRLYVQFTSLSASENVTGGKLNNNNNTFTWCGPSGVLGYAGQRPGGPAVWEC
jgi:hypothetical protein